MLLLHLFDQEADVAVGSLTITSRRAQAVDFTRPFMLFGTGLLMNKDDVFAKDETAPLRFKPTFFLMPFSLGAWIALVVAALTVSSHFSVSSKYNINVKLGSFQFQSTLDYLPPSGTGQMKDNLRWWIIELGESRAIEFIP